MELEWFEISSGIMEALTSLLERRNESLLSPQGQLTQNIDALLAKESPEENEEYRWADLLVSMATGNKLVIDPRSHQRVMRKVNLLNYFFLAARTIQDTPVPEITNQILEHLEETRERLEVAWGKMEYERFRLAGVPLQQLDAGMKKAMVEEIGEEEFAALEPLMPDDLKEEDRQLLTVTLGTRIQNDIYRHILVSVISELWVDYLTRVDALRVSIGLEAFAQRDPLVQYKSQAAEMFKNLLSDIRSGVIGRMFRFQPRRATATIEKGVAQGPGKTPPPAIDQGSDHKKKRKRH
jgi:preprotein translocase subunit SecA